MAGLIVILVATVGVLGWKYKQASKDTTKQAEKTSQRIIASVSKLYLVPTNEKPTVALIQDRSKLDDQEFFKHAENGDYLLVYQKDKVALIYREKDNKLVNVGPVNIDAKAGQTAGASTNSNPQ